MANVQAKARLEEFVLEKLEERGWTVLGGERKGLDLDIDVRFQGTQGKVSLRNAISVPKRAVASAMPSPCFVRIDLGEPQGPPSWWALWDQYEFPGGKYDPPYCATVVHEAYGDGWTTVVGGSVIPKGSWYRPQKTLDAMLSGAERLAPRHREEDRQKALWRTQRHNFGPQRKKVHLFLYVFVLLTFAPLAGVVSTGELEGMEGPIWAQLFAWFIVSMPALAGLIIYLIPFVRFLRRPREPLEWAKALAGMVRSTGAFDSFQLTPFKLRDGIPVVFRVGGYVDEGRAPMAISRVSGESSRHKVSLSADVCELRWPEGVDDAARVLPERWLLIELTGPPEELARLPDHHRSARKDNTIRWLVTGEEVDKGVAEDLFRAVGTTLVAPRAPYR